MATTTKKKGKPMVAHVDHTAQPFTGAVTVDATPVKALLVDLPPGGKRGLRTEGPTIDDVVAELAAAMPGNGTAAGVSATVYQSFTTNTTSIAQLDVTSPPVIKLAEVMVETRAILVDAREQELSMIADAIRSAAKRTKNKAILAPFQKTLAYKSDSAEKGVKTRQAKAAAKAATTTTPAATTPAATAATTTTAAH